ncbi:MAG: [acyl-carrier-protein] S-malonyltransferase [Betaproteobacteria bacterium]|nr:MAG: [acyl-carrier-protein] S-malonyltransferase [Betaproteobacteria bacterium]
MTFAFVFPGQGSQSVGMMKGFESSEAVRSTFAQASEVLKQDMWQLAQSGPAESQNLTVNTQPLMLTAGVAVYRAWLEAGGAKPVLVAGHSLGEYSAWVASGALDFCDALPLVRLRATAMQDAVPVGEGAMAAILGLGDAEVRSACAEAADGDVVEAVNFNAPNQVVIAGHRAAVERAAGIAKSKGAKRAMLLPVSAPFHSSLLLSAAQRLAEHLAGVKISFPAIPVVNNVDAQTVSEPDAIRSALARQACSPVRWVEVIQYMAKAGVTRVIECGPGRVLAGLSKRIHSGLESAALVDDASLASALEAVRRG